MSEIFDYFSGNYAQARRAFREAAASAGAALGAHHNPATGPGGIELSTETARLGAQDAERLLVVISGTHGVECFCGSGLQVGLLKSGLAAEMPRGTAILLIHAINPSGFAWVRRVTEDNVDLNRNFIDHARPHPVNAAVVAAAQEAGIVFNDDYNGEQLDGVAFCQLNVKDGRRRTAATAFLAPVSATAGLTVLTGAHARRLLFEGGRCVGVELSHEGAVAHVRAEREVLVCGGGARNPALMEELSRRLAPRVVETTALHGVPIDQVEALAFAWLARETLASRPGNIPAVTGARGPRVLGAIYPR